MDSDAESRRAAHASTGGLKRLQQASPSREVQMAERHMQQSSLVLAAASGSGVADAVAVVDFDAFAPLSDDVCDASDADKLGAPPEHHALEPASPGMEGRARLISTPSASEVGLYEMGSRSRGAEQPTAFYDTEKKPGADPAGKLWPQEHRATAGTVPKPATPRASLRVRGGAPASGTEAAPKPSLAQKSKDQQKTQRTQKEQKDMNLKADANLKGLTELRKADDVISSILGAHERDDLQRLSDFWTGNAEDPMKVRGNPRLMLAAAS